MTQKQFIDALPEQIKHLNNVLLEANLRDFKRLMQSLLFFKYKGLLWIGIESKSEIIPYTESPLYQNNRMAKATIDAMSDMVKQFQDKMFIVTPKDRLLGYEIEPRYTAIMDRYLARD